MTRQDKKGKRGRHHKDRKNEGKPQQVDTPPQNDQTPDDDPEMQEANTAEQPSAPAP